MIGEKGFHNFHEWAEAIKLGIPAENAFLADAFFNDTVFEMKKTN